MYASSKSKKSLNFLGGIMGKAIKSIVDFKKRYLPKSYQKELLENSTPEEIGQLWAKDTMRKLRKLIWR